MILQAPWFVPGCYRPYINQKWSCGFDFCPGFLQVRMDRSTGLPKWTCNHHCNVDGHGVDFMAICSDRNRQLTKKHFCWGSLPKLYDLESGENKFQINYTRHSFQSLKPCFQNVEFISWWLKQRIFNPRDLLAKSWFNLPPKTHQRKQACDFHVPRCLKRCSIRTTRWGRCFACQDSTKISLSEMPVVSWKKDHWNSLDPSSAPFSNQSIPGFEKNHRVHYKFADDCYNHFSVKNAPVLFFDEPSLNPKNL